MLQCESQTKAYLTFDEMSMNLAVIVVYRSIFLHNCDYSVHWLCIYLWMGMDFIALMVALNHLSWQRLFFFYYSFELHGEAIQMMDI